MPQYLLALYESPAEFANMSPDQIQKIIEKYQAWTVKLEQSKRLVVSQKLRDDGGKVIRRKDGQVKVVDGPYSETKEVLGGYFLINAEGYDEAVRVCHDCPHLRYGGAIELREIEA